MVTVRTFERIYQRADDNTQYRVNIEVADTGKYWYFYPGEDLVHGCFDPECPDVNQHALDALDKRTGGLARKAYR